MGPFRLPGSDRRQTPALTVVGHAAHQHAEQLQASDLGPGLNPQLQQQTAALQAWGPTWEVEGQVERFRLTPTPGLRIVSPGSEVRLCGREVMPHKGDDGGQNLGLVDTLNGLTCVQKNAVTDSMLLRPASCRRYGCARFTIP